MAKSVSAMKILTIDIGGSSVKATLLNSEGKLIKEYEKIVTPPSASPASLTEAVKTLVKNFPEYDNVSVGFPGYVKDGVIKTAPNLGPGVWTDVDFRKKLQIALGKPVRIVNDADLQGLGVVSGKGLEMVITLGTGFGTAVLLNGILLPHIELAHHPFVKSKTYDECIGEKAYKKIGKKAWNNRMKKVITILKIVFNYDRLYISGGNAEKLNFKLDKNIKIVGNKDGIKGGARLWASQK
jgi:polyphosphate glucokinase